MPLFKSPLYDLDDLQGLAYRQIEVLALQYRTDPQAIQALLPSCYQVDDPPLVTVAFNLPGGLDFMAGGGYRIAAVGLAAQFDGQCDHIKGDYQLVMFENKIRPILGGRELLGVHKQQADITRVRRMPDGSMRCEASLWGHLLFGISLPPLRKQNAFVRFIANRQLNSRPWLAYKYLPSIDGPPDASYPTTTVNDVRAEKLWMGGAGALYIGDPSEEDIGCFTAVLDALRTLPVRQVERALHFSGSATLRLDLSRRIR